MNITKAHQELNFVKQRLERIEEYIQDAPPGYLHRLVRNGKSYYERCEFICKANRTGRKSREVTYLPGSDFSVITKLAVKSYCIALSQILLKNESAIRTFESHFEYFPEQAALKKLPNWEVDIISQNTQFVIEDKIKRWLAEPCNQNPYKSEQRNVATLRGDCVRSKSERDIADALFRHSIPYRTDCEIQTSQGPIYADFVILHPKTMELYYWEHFGMLDSANYISKNFDRVARYAAEGILVGERLILTGETSRCSLSTATIEKIIDAYFGG